MSSGELLLTAAVALVVFGPKRMPELAARLGTLIRQVLKFKIYLMGFIEQQSAQLQLQEREQRAKIGDTQYK